MASSSSATLGMNPLLGNLITEKLTKLNYLLWKAQVLPVVRGAQLNGFLDGTMEVPPRQLTSKNNEGKEEKIANPAYSRWVALDQ